MRYVELRYVTFRCPALRHVTLSYATVRSVALRYVTLRYVTLHCVALRCVALHYIWFRCVSLRLVSLRFISLPFVSFRFVVLRFVSLQEMKATSGWGKTPPPEGEPAPPPWMPIQVIPKLVQIFSERATCHCRVFFFVVRTLFSLVFVFRVRLVFRVFFSRVSGKYFLLTSFLFSPSPA